MAILTNKILRGKKFHLYAMERSVRDGVLPGFHYFILEELNGTEYHWLIDTGASCTVIDTLFADKNIAGFPVRPPDLQVEGKMIATSITLELAIIECNILGIESKWLCSDLHFLAERSGLPIGGIIGADIMDALNSRIDLRNRTIVFRNAT